MPTVPPSEHVLPSELWLAPLDVDPARVRAFRPDVARVEWMFLADDYTRLRAFRTALGERFEYCPVGPMLQEVAWRLRRPFLEMIGRLAHRYNSLAWWTSRISERNVMVSPLFLHTCYLCLGLDAVNGRLALADREMREPGHLPQHLDSGPQFIVCQSLAVLRTLARESASANIPVRWIKQPVSRWFSTARAYFRMAGDAVLFVKRRTIASSVARRWAHECGATKPAPNRPIIVLRTFVDEGCIRSDGSFVDRHLPGLCEWLENRGLEVWTAPVLHNVKRSYLDAWRWFYQSPRRKFLNPDEYYRASDILITIMRAVTQATIPRGRLVVGVRGVQTELTELFREERLRIAFDHDALRWMLMARWPLRLQCRHVVIDCVVQGFENMIPEKGVIWGFRRYMPRTRIIGFQHPVPAPMLLCHFVPENEVDVAPLPERIVCNGSLLRKTLIREGLPPDRIVEGPALRYTHLQALTSSAAVATNGVACVLVALPLELSAAAELFEKVVLACYDDGDIRVSIKVHPMMESGGLLQATGIQSLPSHMRLVNEPMEELLGEARVVVSQGSGVLIEAAVFGVPTVVVGREGSLNLNPLDWRALEGSDGCGRHSMRTRAENESADPGPHQKICYGIHEIRKEVRRLWSLGNAERSDYLREAERLLRDHFNARTEERMSVFLTDAPT